MNEATRYLPILLAFLFAVAVTGAMMLAARILGHPSNPSAAKLMAYECGKDPIGPARDRFSVKFYLVAMLFILFDIEAIFLIPWAVVYRDMAATVSRGFVFGEMMVFVSILVAGYLYVWKRGALNWNR
ncbi:MAG: NADH-quinone oxidoreductase subunit A [Acidobacteria bacterium]|nr:NADH-quinone oxidoreductase subunit A [Acidobacteriota bacterium]